MPAGQKTAEAVNRLRYSYDASAQRFRLETICPAADGTTHPLTRRLTSSDEHGQCAENQESKVYEWTLQEDNE